MKSILIKIIVMLLSFISTEFIYSQTKLRKVMPEDYSKWSSLTDEAISADGKWFTYNLQYDNAIDTLFLQNRHSPKKYVFPSVTNGIFSKDGKLFTALDQEKGLLLHDLTTGNQHYIANVNRYEFNATKPYLVVLIKVENQQDLVVIDYENNKKYRVPNITDFYSSPEGKIALVGPKEVKYISLEDGFSIKTIYHDSNAKFKKAVWNTNGSGFAFLQELQKNGLYPTNHELFYYDMKINHLYSLNLSESEEYSGQHIATPMGTVISFSSDNSQLFFYIANPQPTLETEEIVEQWESLSPLEYPIQKYQGNTETIAKLAVWTPATKLVKKLGSNELPEVQLTSDRKYAISFNTLLYEPQYEYYGFADYYITSLETGKEQLLLTKQSATIGAINGSPDGKYINYFKDNNWWIYDCKLDKHTNVTHNLTPSFSDSLYNYPGSQYSYKSPGWSDNGELIVYDAYDIWLLSPDGKVQTKITNGKEQGIVFRIYVESSVSKNQMTLPTHEVDFSKGILLEAFGKDKSSGYYYMSPKRELEKIVHNNSMVTNLKNVAAIHSYSYVEEDSATPPSFKLFNYQKKTTETLIQSNQHFLKYEWGKAELFSYKSTQGDALNGILYYPSNFKKGKKYPMIVYIYESLTKNLHHYYKPTVYKGDGFNSSNYSLDGYLVLFPDITYQMGNPGMSAVNCVASAVNEVSKKGILDENNMGLIGHSFGGYEASFIITQTSMFAAAVAGAPVTDLISNYLTMHWETERSNMWRYESQQFRMGFSPFDDYIAYARNSTIANVSKITTPLLSWTGKEDKNVIWNQGMELHLAMRRLKKQNTFLVYPTEKHILIKPEAQKDLNIRIKEWFDSILKEHPISGTDHEIEALH